MPANYDSTNVGVPYIRVNNIAIQYPPNSLPVVFITQVNAVKLADGTIVELGAAEGLSFTVDMIGNANTPIPLVDPTSGAGLGADTTLQGIMLSILAVIRQQQLIYNV